MVVVVDDDGLDGGHGVYIVLTGQGSTRRC